MRNWDYMIFRRTLPENRCLSPVCPTGNAIATCPRFARAHFSPVPKITHPTGARDNKTTLTRLLIWVFGLCTATGMAAETASFSKTLYPVFEEAGCRACHNPDGVASATRLHFPEQSAPADRIEAFGKSLVVLVDPKNPANSLLLRKPTARVSHAGGQRIQPGSPEEAALLAWIDALVQLKGDELAQAMHYRDEEASGSGAVRPRIMLRRLTHSQYNNTVRDLLGDRSLPANQFPPEDFVNGFKNQYASQNLSPLLEDAYSAAAEKLARAAFRAGNPHNPLTCAPSPACRTEFVQTFGFHAFRRPLRARGTTPLRRSLSTAARLCRRRAARRGSDAAIAQLPIPPRRHAQPETAPLRRGEPALLRALGFHARRRAARRRRTRRIGHAGGRGTRRPPPARRPQSPPGARRVRRTVAALRPRAHRHQGTPRLPPVHAGDRTRHDARSAPLRLQPGVGQSQFHRTLHRRRRLPQRRPGPHLRRRAAGQRFRSRPVPRQL